MIEVKAMKKIYGIRQQIKNILLHSTFQVYTLTYDLESSRNMSK